MQTTYIQRVVVCTISSSMYVLLKLRLTIQQIDAKTAWHFSSWFIFVLFTLWVTDIVRIQNQVTTLVEFKLKIELIENSSTYLLTPFVLDEYNRVRNTKLTRLANIYKCILRLKSTLCTEPLPTDITLFIHWKCYIINSELSACISVHVLKLTVIIHH